MARIKLGPMITDISGSIGGATFQRNRFGMTMRTKPLPLYSQTSAQYTVRRLITILQNTWQNLSDAQRLQWNRFLDFSGQTIRKDKSIKLSGQTLYLKYQLWRSLTDQSLLTTLAYSPMPPFFFLKWVARDAVNMYIDFIGGIDKDLYYFICKLSSPRRENQVYNSLGLRFMYVGFSETDRYDCTDSYEAAFGLQPPLNSWLHYSIQYFSTVSPVYSGVFTGKLQIEDISA